MPSRWRLGNYNTNFLANAMSPLSTETPYYEPESNPVKKRKTQSSCPSSTFLLPAGHSTESVILDEPLGSVHLERDHKLTKHHEHITFFFTVGSHQHSMSELPPPTESDSKQSRNLRKRKLEDSPSQTETPSRSHRRSNMYGIPHIPHAIYNLIIKFFPELPGRYTIY